VAKGKGEVRIEEGIGGGSKSNPTTGGCHDEADAEWIVIRGPLRGHNNMPFGRLTPGFGQWPPSGHI
jgi:hypothetical protein